MTLEGFPAGARRSVALRALDLFSSDDLPEIALHLLELPGSPSAAALAGATAADDALERADLFVKALAELGLALPSKLEAARYLKREIAREAIRGDLRPRDAAALIREVYHAVEYELPHGGWVGSVLGVNEVIGLYYALDGVHARRDDSGLEDELLEALRVIAEEEPESLGA